MTKVPSINQFFSEGKIAVAGVSRTRHKFGNAIFKELRKRGFDVVPVHPHIDDYEGQRCYHTLDELPEEVSAIVINTKNDITLQFSRGCTFKCAYCFKIWSDRYVIRSAENMFEEIAAFYALSILGNCYTGEEKEKYATAAKVLMKLNATNPEHPAGAQRPL